MKICSIIALAYLLLSGCSATKEESMPTDSNAGPASQRSAGEATTTQPVLYQAGPPWQPAPLTAQEKEVIVDKGTEAPFTGKYYQYSEPGAYACRRCGALLYMSDDKFHSDCGWPSFDQEIPGAVKRHIDADGHRIEILCVNCGAHLGHVFLGEGYTDKNTRHCVNSISLVFIPRSKLPLKRAIFAGGCFWGVEHHFSQVNGVLSAVSGFTGGTVKSPTYEQVCTGTTGHAEAVEVMFDPNKVSYERLARLFFEIHDPTQRNGQGPDIGSQYRSAVFYVDEDQKRIAEGLIAALRQRGYDVATQVQPAGEFYRAEDYHQDYIRKHPGHPTCQIRVDRFGKPGALLTFPAR